MRENSHHHPEQTDYAAGGKEVVSAKQIFQAFLHTLLLQRRLTRGSITP